MAEIPGLPFRWNGVRNMMRSLSVPMSGLTAHRRRLETIATNLANAETTRTESGDPYRRQVAVLQRAANGGVEVAGVVEDQSNFVRVYEPGHEDADEMGYVMYPNVDLYQEFSDLMVARRMFEANATVLDAAKAMLNRALDI